MTKLFRSQYYVYSKISKKSIFEALTKKKIKNILIIIIRLKIIQNKSSVLNAHLNQSNERVHMYIDATIICNIYKRFYLYI